MRLPQGNPILSVRVRAYTEIVHRISKMTAQISYRNNNDWKSEESSRLFWQIFTVTSGTIAGLWEASLMVRPVAFTRFDAEFRRQSCEQLRDQIQEIMTPYK